MPAAVVHVEVRGLDADGLQSFYSEVFGWERDESLSVDDYSIVRLGNVEVTAATGPVPDWSAQSAVFFVQVDDIDQTLEVIERLGGRRIMNKQVGPDDFPARHINVFTSFQDPAGNVIGLVESSDG